LNGLEDSGRNPVRQLIKAAARRNLLVLVLEHASIALAVLFGGIVILLLLGTQILAWRWMLLVLVLAGVTAYQRLRGRFVNAYRLTQTLDKRIGSQDTLSTAWYLLESPSTGDRVLAQAQIGRAEELARTVDPSSVFPFMWRRTWALAGALGALAFGLFAVRYLVIHTLSLKPGLVTLSFPEPAAAWERIAKALQVDPAHTAAQTTARIPGQVQQPAGQPLQKPDQNKTSGDQANSNRAEGSNSPGKADKGARSANGQATSSKPSNEPGSQKNNSERAESDKNDSQKDGNPGDRNMENEKASSKPSNANDAEEQSSGLMDKMKDALNGLMAKAQQPKPSPKNEQSSPKDAKAGDQTSRSGQRNAQSDRNLQSSEDMDAQNQQQNAQGQQQASEKAPGAQSKSSEESSSQKGADSQSGIGKQDGEKSLRDAEQLRAMGKLDEIIGKRSASLTGEMMVETRSGNHQQLPTQYSNRIGHHADTGGEIDRNDIPLSLQRYVREYMEQVHKQAESQ
jgi:hypothetical protein